MSEFEDLLKQFGASTEDETLEPIKPSVLIVDDDESIRRGVKRTLSRYWTVTAAESGEEGIEVFKSGNFWTIILDIKMPGMSGFEVCEKINEIDSNVPIIFYTAFQNEHDIQLVLNKYRPFAYLDKGGQYDLIETVKSAVEKYQRVLRRYSYQKKLEDTNLSLSEAIKQKARKQYREQSFISEITSNRIYSGKNLLITGATGF